MAKIRFRDNEQLARKAKDDYMVFRIKSGEKLSGREMVYCFFHWSPFKQFTNVIRFIRARKS